MTAWTKEQRQAIEATNNELLVSAAAGSGKTAVLVERIMRLIQKGDRINRMVIVTFTKAAAAQLRERLQKKLSEEAEKGNAIAREQLQLLPVTQIGTIHSFCGAILKEHFQTVGIDPLARQLDETRRARLFDGALNEAMDTLHERPTPSFSLLTQCFSDETIMDMVREMYRFMMSLAEPFEWLLKNSCDMQDAHSLKSHPYVKTIVSDCLIRLNGLNYEAEALLRELDSPYANQKWRPVLENDADLLESLKRAALGGLDDLLGAFDRPFMRAPTLRKLEGDELDWHENMKTMRGLFKDAVKKAGAWLPTDLDKDAEDMNAMILVLLGLSELITLFHLRFQQSKQREGALDFDDLIQHTLTVLKNKAAREALQDKYDHLFVDEYQDVGDAEETIFQRLHYEHNCLFMVGDVKQSIYRFRLCDPTLFLRKQETFSEDENAPQRKIFLNKNFRSEPEILSAVNTVFESVMKKSVTELAYDEKAHLYPGREPMTTEKTALYLIPYDKTAVPSYEGETLKSDGEFQKAAELIHEQMKKPLYDSEKKAPRKARFRDMAILLPKAKGIALPLAKALLDNGIPTYVDGDEAYFELPEIQRMMALLKVLDNPRNDIAFLAVLKLPAIAFSDGELALIRLADKQRGVTFVDCFMKTATSEGELGRKCEKTLETLENWRFRARHTPLDAIMWALIKESGLYLSAGVKKGGSGRRGNLRLLCEYAANYEKSFGGGLNGFLKMGVQVSEGGEGQTAKAISPKDDLVRIMTIHKSKGLEFPIVFLMGLGGNMFLPDRGKIHPHHTLGLGIPYVNPQLRITRKTLGQKAIQLLSRIEDRAERARLLYVGMTRARERLIMLGTIPKDIPGAWRFSNEYGVYTAQTYLDWLCQIPPCFEQICAQKETFHMQSTVYPQAEMPYDITVCDVYEQQPVDKVDVISTALKLLTAPFIEPADSAVAQRLKSHDAKKEVPLPLKTSVSALAKKAPFLLEEETVLTKAAEDNAIPPLSLADIPDTPAFLKPQKMNAADRGSAVHRVLARASLDGEMGEAVQALLKSGVLTAGEAEAIPLQWLTGFQNSALCRRMKESPRVKREWQFNLKLFADKDMLVQGVIDMCFLENESWVLCDYKTDTQSDAETLVKRYQEQVQIYAVALERITGTRVLEAWLFALRTGEAIKVPIKGETI